MRGLHPLSRLCTRRSTLAFPRFHSPRTTQTRRASRHRCFYTRSIWWLWAKCAYLPRHPTASSSDRGQLYSQYHQSGSRVWPGTLASSCPSRPWGELIVGRILWRKLSWQCHFSRSLWNGQSAVWRWQGPLLWKLLNCRLIVCYVLHPFYVNDFFITLELIIMIMLAPDLSAPFTHSNFTGNSMTKIYITSAQAHFYQK